MTERMIKNPELTQKVIEWDIYNWSRAVSFWEDHIADRKFTRGLELGSRRGGLSLYFAKNGVPMITSDISDPSSIAGPIHKEEGVSDLINYMEFGALDIPSDQKFDLIVFKSILGAVCSNGKTENLAPALSRMYDALLPGGVLVFAENLYASPFHNFLRKKFISWSSHWNYLHLSDIIDSLEQFDKVEYQTYGFFACFGRNENQKRILGKLDRFIEKIIPGKNRYILSVVAFKGE